jgi:hypothetical protein
MFAATFPRRVRWTHQTTTEFTTEQVEAIARSAFAVHPDCITLKEKHADRLQLDTVSEGTPPNEVYPDDSHGPAPVLARCRVDSHAGAFRVEVDGGDNS